MAGRGAGGAPTWLWVTVLGITVALPVEFSHLHVTVARIPLYPLDALLISTGLAYVAAGRPRVFGGRAREASSFLVPLTLWGIWGMAECLRGIRGDPLRSVRDFAINYYAITFVLSAWVATRPRARALLNLGFLAGSGLLALKGIWAVVAGRDLLPEASGFCWATGTYLAGAESCFLGMSALALVSLAPASRRQSRAAWAPLLAGGLVAVSILSQQRSALAALLVGGAAVLAVHPKRAAVVRRGLAALAAAVVFGVLLAAALGVAVRDRPNPYVLFLEKTMGTVRNPGQDGTRRFRLDAWKEAWRRLRASPVAGEGFGKPFVFWCEADRDYRRGDVRPHNTYLTVLYKMGLGGFGLLAWFAWSVSRSVGRRWRRLGAESRLRLAPLLGSLALLLSYGSVNLLLESPFSSIFVWTLAGIAVSEALPGSGRAAARTR